MPTPSGIPPETLKMAGAALVPFGRQVVRLDELPQPPADGTAIGSRAVPRFLRELRLSGTTAVWC